MTVSYNCEVATSKFFTFAKLLFKWRGSTYKILLTDFILFGLMYTFIAVIYHLMLADPRAKDNRQIFELLCVSTNKFLNWIPLTFVLAFYVSLVIKRWWDMVTLLPWPDNLAMKVTSLILGFDDDGRRLRRSIMRYINLSLVLLLRDISVKAKKNFPTLGHVVNAGLLTPDELVIIEEIESPDRKYWIPLVWCTALVRRARMEGRIQHDLLVQVLVVELDRFRESLLRLKNYDWINIPLAYTQVVTIAVHVYFFACLFARQRLEDVVRKNHELAPAEFFYVPVFTILEFFFYMGWLKVAESLVNPFGENDEDLEILYIIDRNIKYSAVVVDLLHNQYPELQEPLDESVPPDMPYTVAAMKFKRETPYAGSTVGVETSGEDAYIVKTKLSAAEKSVLLELEENGDAELKDSHVVKTVSRSKTAGSVPSIPVIVRPAHRVFKRGGAVGGVLRCAGHTFRRWRRRCCCGPRHGPYTIIVKQAESTKAVEDDSFAGSGSDDQRPRRRTPSLEDKSSPRSTSSDRSLNRARSPSQSSLHSGLEKRPRSSGGFDLDIPLESRTKRPMTAKERNSRWRNWKSLESAGPSKNGSAFTVAKTESLQSSETGLSWNRKTDRRSINRTFYRRTLRPKDDQTSKTPNYERSPSATTSAKGSSRFNFRPQGSFTSFNSDIRIRRPHHVRVYDSHTSLTSHQSIIDDVPRIRKPGHSRASSQASPRSRHPVYREDVNLPPTSSGQPEESSPCIQTTSFEPELPPVETLKTDGAATYAMELGETIVTLTPEITVDNDVTAEALTDSVTVVIEEVTAALSSVDAPDLPAVPTEKQVTFNLDPQTILVDPSMPAASTMDGLELGPTTESQESCAIIAVDSKFDTAEESSVNAEEETDTCSTVSSVTAAEAYRPDFMEYVYEKKPGVVILETIAECSSDASLASAASSIAAISQNPTAPKTQRRFSVGQLGPVDERLEEKADRSASAEALAVTEAQDEDQDDRNEGDPDDVGEVADVGEALLESISPTESEVQSVIVTSSQLATLDDAVEAIVELADDVDSGFTYPEDRHLEETLRSLTEDE